MLGHIYIYIQYNIALINTFLHINVVNNTTAHQMSHHTHHKEKCFEKHLFSIRQIIAY